MEQQIPPEAAPFKKNMASYLVSAGEGARRTDPGTGDMVVGESVLDLERKTMNLCLVWGCRGGGRGQK